MRIQQQKQHWKYSNNEEMLPGNACCKLSWSDPDASEFIIDFNG